MMNIFNSFNACDGNCQNCYKKYNCTKYLINMLEDIKSRDNKDDFEKQLNSFITIAKEIISTNNESIITLKDNINESFEKEVKKDIDNTENKYCDIINKNSQIMSEQSGVMKQILNNIQFYGEQIDKLKDNINTISEQTKKLEEIGNLQKAYEKIQSDFYPDEDLLSDDDIESIQAEQLDDDQKLAVLGDSSYADNVVLKAKKTLFGKTKWVEEKI